MSLNDPRWGRQGEEENPGQREDRNPRDAGDDRPHDIENGDTKGEDEQRRGQNPGAGNGRQSELDELWGEFNRTMQSILGGKGQENSSRGSDETEEGREDSPRDYLRRGPNGRKPGLPAGAVSGKGALLILAVLALVWAGTGFYIVPEGQVGVVTTFGKYTRDTQPGFSWHIPYPVQDAELVDVSRVRKTEIGMYGASRLKEALMLTDDENIVDVQFNVQYRIKPHAAKEYLFRTRAPEQSVHQAAESAMREVVGRKAMDSVLFESKQEIAENVRVLMQQMLDRYETGIEVMSVAIQNAQPPEQVQAAFNDAVKAGQDRERQINEGEAYANAVIPKAKGLASRLTQEAEGYKARVVETATGESERFASILAQYEKAPRVTRDRMYIDAMREIYANARKVYVDTKSGSNLLYLPLDKLVQEGAAAVSGQSSQTASSAAVQSAPASAGAGTASGAADISTDLDPRTVLRLRGR